MSSLPIDPQFRDRVLGDRLVDRGIITREELEACLNRQAQNAAEGRPKPLAEVLVEERCATPAEVARGLAALSEDDWFYKATQQIPGYQLLSKLGQGDWATVFKVKQLSMDKIAAMKVLPKRLADNPALVERFHRAARLAAELRHSNVVAVVDQGDSGGYHYVVMEYVEGHPLSDFLSGGRSMGEREALCLMLQAARGLDQFHRAGLLHRGVRPRNILVSREGAVKLCPSMLVRAVGDYAAAEQEAGRAWGATPYMSPEQVRGDFHLDYRVDVYGFGAVLYHALTARVPFDGSSPETVARKHLQEPLAPADHVNRSISPRVSALISRAMAKRREDRHCTMAEVIHEMESILSQQQLKG